MEPFRLAFPQEIMHFGCPGLTADPNYKFRKFRLPIPCPDNEALKELLT